MSGSNPGFPPLSRRNKFILSGAGMLALGYAITVSLVRLSLVYWWLAECETANLVCTAAELAFNWWWILLIAGLVLIAYCAHRMTADRLVRK